MTAVRSFKPLGAGERTKVGNGRGFYQDIDGRLPRARRFKEIYVSLALDLGGDLTAAQDQIARRAVEMAVWAEGEAAKLMTGEPVNMTLFSTVANAQRRLLADLGLKRVPLDVTKSLDAYLSEHAANADADDDAGEDAQADSESAAAVETIIDGDAS